MKLQNCFFFYSIFMQVLHGRTACQVGWMLTLDGSSAHWELQLGWSSFVFAEKGQTSKSFTLFLFKDKDGKIPAGWNVKGVRKQSPSAVIAPTVRSEQSHPGKKKKKPKQ